RIGHFLWRRRRPFTDASVNVTSPANASSSPSCALRSRSRRAVWGPPDESVLPGLWMGEGSGISKANRTYFPGWDAYAISRVISVSVEPSLSWMTTVTTSPALFDGSENECEQGVDVHVFVDGVWPGTEIVMSNGVVAEFTVTVKDWPAIAFGTFVSTR